MRYEVVGYDNDYGPVLKTHMDSSSSDSQAMCIHVFWSVFSCMLSKYVLLLLDLVSPNLPTLDLTLNE